MKPTFDIVMATAELFHRFCSELPEKYMYEVFGKDDAVLAERCLQYPKISASMVYFLIFNLNSDERKALAKYINKRIPKF